MTAMNIASERKDAALIFIKVIKYKKNREILRTKSTLNYLHQRKTNEVNKYICFFKKKY